MEVEHHGILLLTLVDDKCDKLSVDRRKYRQL